MKNIIIILLLLVPLGFSGQEPKVNTLDNVENEWVDIKQHWRFQKGDDMSWADPEFDDADWSEITGLNLLMPENVALTEKNNIIWFRTYINLDRPILDALMLRVFQTGASEIYLDGQLLHRLGTINSEPEKAKPYNPSHKLLSFPLVEGRRHIIAIRYMNLQSDFPIYNPYANGIFLSATTLSHVDTDNFELTYEYRNWQSLAKKLHIVLGMGLFMFVLFMGSFLFFPSEKINGYFAISSLFLTLFIAILILDVQNYAYSFKIDFLSGLFSIAYLLSSLFCIYRIFKRKLGAYFWSITVISAIGICCFLLVPASYLGPVTAVLVLLEVIRVSIKSLGSDKTGALIFLSAAVLNFVYWIFIVLERLAIFVIPNIDKYQPIGYILLPLSIAIYLGYTFGIRSKKLRSKLVQVEQLSKEKEDILFLQNETLEKLVKERTNALNQSLENLKAAQVQLIYSEKMASLGELTAGIAHEIQNPLNFVNNFSEVSNELMDEMNEEIEKGDLGEAKFIAKDIKQNLEKINHHGKRADAIVKGMLLHSRSSTGTKEPTNINKLADEYLRLAYHGLRAKDKSFNATMERDFDESIGLVNVIPQDMGRVILNLITNAFYAVNEKKTAFAKAEKEENIVKDSYIPTVTVSTIKESNNVTISVKDNGNGMPKHVVEKIFQPFFTTKPTGQGTGLGLSMSYDIVAKGHGGKLNVETKEGEGTTFSINIPK